MRQSRRYLAREIKFDPDIWIVEVEDRNGTKLSRRRHRLNGCQQSFTKRSRRSLLRSNGYAAPPESNRAPGWSSRQKRPSGSRAFGPTIAERLPDRDQVLRRMQCDLVIELRQRVDAFHRMADGGIDEKKYAVEQIAGNAQRLGRDHDRFTKFIVDDAPRLLARNVQRLRKFLDKIFAACGPMPPLPASGRPTDRARCPARPAGRGTTTSRLSRMRRRSLALAAKNISLSSPATFAPVATDVVRGCSCHGSSCRGCTICLRLFDRGKYARGQSGSHAASRDAKTSDRRCASRLQADLAPAARMTWRGGERCLPNCAATAARVVASTESIRRSASSV